MKKNFKRITKASQLVGGQMYIRALINCHGRTWLEVFTVYGKPYTQKLKGYEKAYHKIDTKGTFKFSKRSYCHISDALLMYNGNKAPSNTGGLYRYSNDIYNKLKGLLNDRRQLMTFLGGKEVTDKVFSDEIHSWGFSLWSDSQGEFANVSPGTPEPFADDPSVIALLNKEKAEATLLRGLVSIVDA